MGKPYSMDLRERLVAAVETGGLSCNQAAKQFGVAISTAINWVKRFRQTGSIAPGKMGGHKPKAIAGEYRLWLLQRIKDGDFTLRGLVVELVGRGLKADYRSVWEFVHAKKLSFKKSVVAGERDRPDVARRRAQWTKYQGRIAPERLVFIDETWTKDNMAPLCGWAPCGQRLVGKVPHGRWKTARHSWPLYASTGSMRPACSRSRSMGRAFELTLNASSCRRSGRETSSSWTISAAIRVKSCTT